MVKIIECPRDAMQGIKQFIPTQTKLDYINQLMKVGFDTIDFGSFVNPKLVPQMADTPIVADKINLDGSQTKLLSIVANLRGAEEAAAFDKIHYVGFPFSISETFQQRNANAGIEESLGRVEEIYSLCQRRNKELLVYISMGFGNPYNDPYHPDLVYQWTEKIVACGVRLIAVADTVAMASPDLITQLFEELIPRFPDVEFGAHFHTAPHNWLEKIEAAYRAGCRRFDTAIFGYGGCPMVKDTLIGNMPTEQLVNFFHEKDLGPDFRMNAFEDSLRMASKVFPHS